jgi:hypothetical protein
MREVIYGSAVALLTVVGLGASAEAATLDNSLFLPAWPTSTNIQVVKVDVKYSTAADYSSANRVGVFTANGVATNIGGSGDPNAPGYQATPIVNGTYSLAAYFNLDTGDVLLNDSRNFVSVTGSLNNTFQTLFASTHLNQFGFQSSTDTFDLVYYPNTGTISTGYPLETRILGVSINGNSTYGFSYSGSLTANQVLWDNVPLIVGGKTIEKGTANIWAPLPSAASGGLGLMALGLVRRGSRRRDL